MQKIIVTSQEELRMLFRETLCEVLHQHEKTSGEGQDEILNVRQACELLNLAIPTLYSHTSQRKIPFFKRGKKLYFRKSELLQWILKGKKPTIAEIQSVLEHKNPTVASQYLDSIEKSRL